LPIPLPLPIFIPSLYIYRGPRATFNRSQYYLLRRKYGDLDANSRVRDKVEVVPYLILIIKPYNKIRLKVKGLKYGLRTIGVPPKSLV